MAFDRRQIQYLREMDITPWEIRPVGPSILAEATGAVVVGPVDEVVGGAPDEADCFVDVDQVGKADWASLESLVAGCQACPLHQQRTQTVFGVGNKRADWMVIGEAPGADEDRLGEPFVGRAGKLLNNMLTAVGVKREQAYIANILKCRPTNNRDPNANEMIHCEHYLKRQVALIQPKLILAVGRVAAHALIKTEDNLSKMRGRVFHYGARKIPLIVTYHPAYLLRSPNEKRKSWQDLQLARMVLSGEQSKAEGQR